MLRLTASKKAGSREHRFETREAGQVDIVDVRRSAALQTLWNDLRTHDIVTVCYADGRTHVVSLSGAMKTLPPRPCG